jgi:hypothetical protein
MYGNNIIVFKIEIRQIMQNIKCTRGIMRTSSLGHLRRNSNINFLLGIVAMFNSKQRCVKLWNSGRRWG